jgi:peroxiredoxin family protein
VVTDPVCILLPKDYLPSAVVSRNIFSMGPVIATSKLQRRLIGIIVLQQRGKPEDVNILACSLLMATLGMTKRELRCRESGMNDSEVSGDANEVLTHILRC